MYIYSHVRHCFPDLYKDKNAQTAYKARISPTGRGNDQTTIYIPIGFIHAYSAFSRVGHIKIKYHVLLLSKKKVPF